MRNRNHGTTPLLWPGTAFTWHVDRVELAATKLDDSRVHITSKVGTQTTDRGEWLVTEKSWGSLRRKLDAADVGTTFVKERLGARWQAVTRG